MAGSKVLDFDTSIAAATRLFHGAIQMQIDAGQEVTVKVLPAPNDARESEAFVDMVIHALFVAYRKIDGVEAGTLQGLQPGDREIFLNALETNFCDASFYINRRNGNLQSVIAPVSLTKGREMEEVSSWCYWNIKPSMANEAKRNSMSHGKKERLVNADENERSLNSVADQIWRSLAVVLYPVNDETKDEARKFLEGIIKNSAVTYKTGWQGLIHGDAKTETLGVVLRNVVRNTLEECPALRAKLRTVRGLEDFARAPRQCALA